MLRSIIDADTPLLAEPLPANGVALGPSISNRDVLTFNALVYAMRTFVSHLLALERRIEDVHVIRQPLNLASVHYV